MAQLLDGKALSEKLVAEISTKIATKSIELRAPHLAAILIGDHAPSKAYVNNKIKTCEKVGMASSLHSYSSDITEAELLNLIEKLNRDNTVDGILVQLPLPSHINSKRIIEAILPSKDVDGFHPLNIGNLAKGYDCFVPATPLGVTMLLDHYKIKTGGKHCVILGRSAIVGQPLSFLLARNGNPGNCTVTLCHSKTVNITHYTRQADILIAALGIPNFVKKEMVKPGAVVIDVGINRVEDLSKKAGYRLTGDVDFEAVQDIASWITPVPGGVGPMTIAALIFNTYKAWSERMM
jgi:methylenetetrahydrofolate dehydrogenase (NADP+)/methenyltetrahydrofolate cyclohydrolase